MKEKIKEQKKEVKIIRKRKAEEKVNIPKKIKEKIYYYYFK